MWQLCHKSEMRMRILRTGVRNIIFKLRREPDLWRGKKRFVLQQTLFKGSFHAVFIHLGHKTFGCMCAQTANKGSMLKWQINSKLLSIPFKWFASVITETNQTFYNFWLFLSFLCIKTVVWFFFWTKIYNTYKELQQFGPVWGKLD